MPLVNFKNENFRVSKILFRASDYFTSRTRRGHMPSIYVGPRGVVARVVCPGIAYVSCVNVLYKGLSIEMECLILNCRM